MNPSSKCMRLGCNGKRRYESLDEAKASIRGMTSRTAKQGNHIVSFMRAYGCACGGTHIGSTKEINWEMVAALSSPNIKLKAVS